jgi:hypothetical protein
MEWLEVCTLVSARIGKGVAGPLIGATREAKSDSLARMCERHVAHAKLSILPDHGEGVSKLVSPDAAYQRSREVSDNAPLDTDEPGHLPSLVRFANVLGCDGKLKLLWVLRHDQLGDVNLLH